MSRFIDYEDTQGTLFGTAYKRCHEEHPALKLGGGVLLGGGCAKHERHEDVSLYVALDSSMQHPMFRLDMDMHNIPQCLYYPIVNMRAPNRPDKFEVLIDVILEYLNEGRVVHVGCIGGHGRTGLVIAAVVSRLGIAGPENDCIGWVRENYCKKAVESAEQEGYLVTHFGAKPVPVNVKVDKRFAGF